MIACEALSFAALTKGVPSPNLSSSLPMICTVKGSNNLQQSKA